MGKKEAYVLSSKKKRTMNYVKIQKRTGRNQGKESWSRLNFVEKLKGRKKLICAALADNAMKIGK